jgi:hypothetical protein
VIVPCPMWNELTRAVVSINIDDGYFAALISVILISNDKVFPASG